MMGAVLIGRPCERRRQAFVPARAPEPAAAFRSGSSEFRPVSRRRRMNFCSGRSKLLRLLARSTSRARAACGFLWSYVVGFNNKTVVVPGPALVKRFVSGYNNKLETADK